MKHIAQGPHTSYSLLHAMLFACACNFTMMPALAATPSSGIRVQGPGAAPQRLKTFDWSQSVTIPPDALQKADHRHRVLLPVNSQLRDPKRGLRLERCRS